jgi:hypothetical protein
VTNQTNEPAKSPWIHSPLFDILFIANVSWVLLLIPAIIHTGSGTVDFWQVYYLVMPHRWMTLFLVATDRDRRDNHGRLLLSIVLGLAVIVGGSYWSSGAFLVPRIHRLHLECLALRKPTCWHTTNLFS